MKRGKTRHLPLLFLLFITASTLLISYLVARPPLTGVATTQYGTVSLTVNAPPEPSEETTTNVTALGAGAAGGGKTRDVTLRITPSEFFTTRAISATINADLTRQLTLTNDGEITQMITLTTNLNILTFSTTTVTLRPDEEATITLHFDTRKPGVHTGTLTLQSEFTKKTIPIAVTIHPTDVTFTLTTRLDAATLTPGEALPFHVTVTNLQGDFLDLTYAVKDATNKELFRVTETKPVNTALTLDKKIRLPPMLKQGTYAFIITANYKGTTDASLHTITLRHPLMTPRTEQPTLSSSIATPLLLAALLTLALVHLLIRHHTKKKLHF